MDDAIKERGIVIWVFCIGRRVAEVVNSSCPASGFANGGVGGITVDVKLHSTGVIFDDRLWISCQLIQELGDIFGFVISCFGLFKGDVIEGNQKSVV